MMMARAVNGKSAPLNTIPHTQNRNGGHYGPHFKSNRLNTEPRDPPTRPSKRLLPSPSTLTLLKQLKQSHIYFAELLDYLSVGSLECRFF